MLHFLVPASDPTVTPDPFRAEISRPNSGLQLSSCPSARKHSSGSGCVWGAGAAYPLGLKTRAPAQGQHPWDSSAGESRTPQPRHELQLFKNLI